MKREVKQWSLSVAVHVQGGLRKMRIQVEIVVGAGLKVYQKKMILVGFPPGILGHQKIWIQDVNSVPVVEPQGFRR
jgi:hypothetical protein